LPTRRVADGFVRTETRLEKIARNTGTRHQDLVARIEALEKAVHQIRSR